MPRLRPSLLLEAAYRSRYLPRLLIECRDLPSASNELRWLRERAIELSKHDAAYRTQQRSLIQARLLLSYVRRRSRGEPLQYLLGNQPFGDLDVLCRKDVLIPRPETEVYTMKLAECLKRILSSQGYTSRPGLRVLDLCTGTGCIALLLHSLLRPFSASKRTCDDVQTTDLQVVGLDISMTAINLANENKLHNITSQALRSDAQQDITFHIADVLKFACSRSDHVYGESAQHFPTLLNDLLGKPSWRTDDTWDVVISNPPYISESDFQPGGTTTKSVRNFEPRLALVPPRTADNKNSDGDLFYVPIMRAALQVDAKVIVVEIGDSKQSRRVCELADQLMRTDGNEYSVEVWRDDGSTAIERTPIPGSVRDIEGSSEAANDRAVVIWRNEWALWRGESLKYGDLST